MDELCALNNCVTYAIYALISEEDESFVTLAGELRASISALIDKNAPKKPVVDDRPKQTVSAAKKYPVKRKSEYSSKAAKQEKPKAEYPVEESFDANTFYYSERYQQSNVSPIYLENQQLAFVSKEETPLLDSTVQPSDCNVEIETEYKLASCLGFYYVEVSACSAQSSAEKPEPAYPVVAYSEQEFEQESRNEPVEDDKPSMSDASIMVQTQSLQNVDVERVIETHFEELKPQVSYIYALQSTVFERYTELINRLMDENAKLSELYESQRQRQAELERDEPQIDLALASFDCNGIEFSDGKNEPEEPQYDFASLAKSFGFAEQSAGSTAAPVADLRDCDAKKALAEYKQYYYTGELPPPKRQIELLIGGKYSRTTKYGVGGRPVKVWQ